MARKVARPFIEQTLECSDRCNCKGFGARSRIRTDDLLFTSLWGALVCAYAGRECP